MGALREHHLRLLEVFRHSMNLIGPGPAEAHFEDADRALSDLDAGGRWVDLGSGAGFPGLVLADLYPDLEIDLVDSRRKRCWFLDHVVAEAGGRRGIRVLCQRVEDLDDGGYDGVVARAFAPPDLVLTHARRLLRPGGCVVLFLQDDAPDLSPDGFVREEVRHYRVDGRGRRSEVWRRE